MGNCHAYKEIKYDNAEKGMILLNLDKEVHINDFKCIECIGIGGFGRVWKVQHKKDGLIMAMKMMNKLNIYDMDSVDNIVAEKNLLCKLEHP
jgi:serine/threonine protein kinase